MRCLLLEPDAGVAQAVETALARGRIVCDVSTEESGACLVESYDERWSAYAGLLVGNVEDPREIIEELRRSGTDLPILVLLDMRRSDVAVDLLRAGADDVLVKPVHGPETAARIEAILRRGSERLDGAVRAGPLTIHVDGRDPEVDGRPIKLSQREHSILTLLARHFGRVVAKDNVYDSVYGLMDAQPIEKVIDVYICKLRRKLGEATGGKDFIETVPGRGYKLDLPERTRRRRAGGRPALIVDQSVSA